MPNMFRATIAVAAIGLAGCQATLADEEHVFVAVTPAAAITGSTLQAILHNRSDETVGTGILPCTAGLERRVEGAWVDVTEGHSCIQPLVIISSGAAYPFTLQAPNSPGDYRLRVRISLDDRDPPGQHLVVWSQPFKATAP